MEATRKRLYGWVADGGHGTGHALVMLLIISAVAASVGAAMVETVPDAGPLADDFVWWADRYAAILFSVEYIARIWLTPDGDIGIAAGGAARARWAYFRSFYGIVDLIAVLPAWAAFVVPVGREFFELVGVLTLLKLARYMSALPLVGAVLKREGRSLMAAATTMAVLLVIVSTVMYLLERHAQPEVFSSIPNTMWWGIVTMATVGYGDMSPITPVGRVFGGFTMMLGIAMFAVPAGILATGFAEELKKRDFVVSWRLVARVPFFARLDAARIASIAGLLHAQIVPPNTVIVRKGDPADAMFFIMEGEVEVDVQPQPVRLKAGQFFGEVALLRDLQRTATVSAVSECRLLTLDVADFRRLIETHPDLKTEIERVASQRQPGE